MKPKPASKTGFTLIELLVVVAVIAILAGLLLSSLSTAKRSATLANCRSNLRQLELTLRIYVEDNSATYPYLLLDSGAIDDRLWLEMLGQTAGLEWRNRQPFTCPATIRQQAPYYARNYGYNARGYQGAARDFLGLGLRRDDDKRFATVRESLVRTPVAMIALGDDFTGNGPNGEIIEGGYTVSRSRSFSFGGSWTAQLIRDESRLVRERHTARAGLAFADGHVETLRLSQLFTDTADEALARWNADHEPHR